MLSVENFRGKRVIGKGADRGDECPNPVYLVNRAEERWVKVPCRQRRCRVCGPGPWKRYMLRRIFSGLAGVDLRDVLLVTVTAPSGAPLTWNDGAVGRCGELIRLLRGIFKGARLEYHRTGETQSRGLIHYHIILRGLRFLPHSLLMRVVVRSGFGPVCWVARPDVRRGGVKGWVFYTGKYLTKGVFEWDFAQHVCTHSRGWSLDWRPGRERVGGWHWVGSEAEAYVELMHGEAVKGVGAYKRVVGGGRSVMPRPLTASGIPPPEAGKAGAWPDPRP